MNYYFHKYNLTQDSRDANPFGFSGRRIGDIYAGLTGDFGAASKWKQYRRTQHDHNPVNDAIGNAEALITIVDQYKLKGVKGLKLK